MSLSTYFLEYVARLRRRRRAYAPTSNTASHDNHEKILHGFPFLSHDDYGAPLCGPSGRRSSANKISKNTDVFLRARADYLSFRACDRKTIGSYLEHRRFRTTDVNRKFTDVNQMFLLLARFNAQPMSYKTLSCNLTFSTNRE